MSSIVVPPNHAAASTSGSRSSSSGNNGGGNNGSSGSKSASDVQDRPPKERMISLADALRAGAKRKTTASKKPTGGSAANQSKRSRVAAAATEAAGAAVASFSASVAASSDAAQDAAQQHHRKLEMPQNADNVLPPLPPMPAALIAALESGGIAAAAVAQRNMSSTKNTRTSAIAKTLNAAEVAAAASSMSELIFARQRQWDEHHRQVATYRERLERAEQQCKTFKRTRRNIKSYNALLERQAECRKDLALLEMEEPNLQQFYNDLLDFLTQQDKRQETTAPSVASAENTAVALPSNESKNTGSDAENAVDDQPDERTAADQNTPAPTIIGPLHRNRRITAAAPILTLSHFDALAMQCRRKQATSMEKDSNAHENEEDALFDAAIANDLCTYAPYDSLHPLAMLVSPTSVGVASSSRYQGDDDDEPPETMSVERALNAQQMSDRLRAAALSLQTTCAASSSSVPADAASMAGAGDDKKIMVTIGKAERAQMMSGSENRNRLNVKMKDIRNMKNLSMLNYVTVDQRETTREERQHERLVDFFTKREQQRSATQAPSYDDARCDACKEPLVIDPHTGMVACPNKNCGLAYPDGVDSHRLDPVRHEYHSKFEYLKSGHLMSLLKRFQAKESTVIPRDVLDRVVRQLVDREGYVVTREIEHGEFTVPASTDKQGPNIASISTKKVRATLRKLVLNRLYDHLWQIHWILTFIKPHQFTALEEQEFQAVFDAVEQIWPLFKPKNSENFLFYWFVIRKTAQLLGHPDEIVDSFPMLKNAKKHMQKEKLWKRMMLHLGWPYYESKHIL